MECCKQPWKRPGSVECGRERVREMSNGWCFRKVVPGKWHSWRSEDGAFVCPSYPPACAGFSYGTGQLRCQSLSRSRCLSWGPALPGERLACLCTCYSMDGISDLGLKPSYPLCSAHSKSFFCAKSELPGMWFLCAIEVDVLYILKYGSSLFATSGF